MIAKNGSNPVPGLEMGDSMKTLINILKSLNSLRITTAAKIQD